MKKRHNPYNVDDVMKKFALSRENAESYIKDLKFRTSGSLASYIKRYGEVEGRERYDEFCRKSAHTEDTFKLKYGDDWSERWKDYIASKDSRSDDYFKKMCGENWEEVRNKFISDWSYKLSFDGFKERYGDVEGERRYNEINLKKSNTLDSFKKKYGDVDGETKYLEYRLSKDSSSLNFFVNKYGELIGTEKYNEKCKKSSPIYNALIKIYNSDVAEELYKSYINGDREIGVSLEKSKFFKPKTSHDNISKSSMIFFDALEQVLNRKLKYGTRKDELCLFDVENLKKYYYDCFDCLTNVIIEYHGIAFHYNGQDENWTGAFGKSANSSLVDDRLRREFAESLGYKYIVVWSDEVDTLAKRVKKIQELKELLNENE